MDEDTEEATAAALSRADVVEYCRIQAGLLSGEVERMGEEATDLLEEVDEHVTEIRARLADHKDRTRTETPPSTDGPAPGGPDVAELESLQADLEEKQARVEQKQARMEATQELAASYVGLAEDIESDGVDGTTALERVLQFEADEDAPAYFTERETLLEAAASSGASRESGEE
ncbi:hypothetical protein [Natrarchaeobaculum aegyptiacum]|uniref:Uncharacterized protein n=1 Tax=Natrarchaeobaculum aegyptiacum TaxID=745377 RepID=A0A2Z2HSA5_9EURY|nr:hypothetical protein [Natrarchaeobaculum aegyptiacum]ARS90081.1 hypothetical protein B1756_10305 [Natrarchaeobaculum aegyptiacum]